MDVLHNLQTLFAEHYINTVLLVTIAGPILGALFFAGIWSLQPPGDLRLMTGNMEHKDLTQSEEKNILQHQFHIFTWFFGPALVLILVCGAFTLNAIGMVN